MIGPGTGVRVYLACGVTDMRKGITGLASKAQEQLRQNACSGAASGLPWRQGRQKSSFLHWDGQGFCLYYKILEEGPLPLAVAGGRCRAADIGAACDAVGRD